MNKIDFSDKIIFKKSKEAKQRERIGFNQRLPMSKKWKERFKDVERKVKNKKEKQNVTI